MTPEFDDAVGQLPHYRLSAAAQEQHLRMIAQLPLKPTPHRSSPFRRRWVLVLAAVLGLGAAGVGTAAAFGVFSAPPTQRSVAHCFRTDDMDDPTQRISFAVAASGDGSDPTEQDAARQAKDICQGVWSQGRMSQTDLVVRLDPRPPPWDYPVPPLALCVLDSGEVGVFVGRADKCNQLGLPNAHL